MLTRICSLLLFVLVMSAESRAQATPPAAGPAGLIAKVEKASGKSLNDAQKEAIGAQSRKTREKLLEQQQIFVKSISAEFKVSEDKVKDWMPKIGESNAGFDKNMIPKLEKEIGRKITADELNSIRKIDSVKKAAAKAIQGDLAKVISEQSGLKPDQVAPLLPKLGL